MYCKQKDYSALHLLKEVENILFNYSVIQLFSCLISLKKFFDYIYNNIYNQIYYYYNNHFKKTE